MRNIEATATQVFKENKDLYIDLVGNLNSDYMGYVGAIIDTNMKIHDYKKKHDTTMVLYHESLKKELVTRFLKFSADNRMKICR